MVTAPLMLPLMDGLNVMFSVQVAFDASGPTQPLALKLPLALTEEMVRELPLTFLTLTVFAALVVPITSLVNLALVGVNFKGAVTVPVPDPESVTFCGLNAAPSAMVSAPLMMAFAVGVKIIAILQVEFAASVAPQVVPVPVIE